MYIYTHLETYEAARGAGTHPWDSWRMSVVHAHTHAHIHIYMSDGTLGKKKFCETERVVHLYMCAYICIFSMP